MSWQSLDVYIISAISPMMRCLQNLIKSCKTYLLILRTNVFLKKINQTRLLDFLIMSGELHFSKTFVKPFSFVVHVHMWDFEKKNAECCQFAFKENFHQDVKKEVFLLDIVSIIILFSSEKKNNWNNWPVRCGSCQQEHFWIYEYVCNIKQMSAV